MLCIIVCFIVYFFFNAFLEFYGSPMHLVAVFVGFDTYLLLEDNCMVLT